MTTQFVFDLPVAGPPPVRPTDPDTSHAAARANTDYRVSLRNRILIAITAAGSAGMTDDELVDKLETYKPTTITARGGLAKRGQVEDSGKRRLSHQGCEMIVWQSVGIPMVSRESLLPAFLLSAG